MRKIILAALFIILLIAPIAEVQELEYKLYLSNIARKYDMATFPNTGVIETFTGANGTTPPNANWTNDLLGVGGGSGIQIQSNEGAGLGGAVDSAYWSAGTFGPDCESYMEVPTRPSDGADVTIFARVQNPGVTVTMAGYALIFERNDAGNDEFTLIRIDAGPVNTQIGSQIAAVFSDGDWFGMKLVGDEIQIWHNPTGTGWVQVGTRTDATYNVAGNLGLICNDATCRVDNFGGGALAASSATTTGLWDIALPEAAENMAVNPSFEIAGNFAAVGGGTMTRVVEYGWVGLYGGRIQSAADDEGGSVTLSALTNAIHYATVRVRGTLPTAWDWSLNDSEYYAPDLLLDYDGTWSLYGLEFPAIDANASTTLYIRQSGAGAGDFYVDGVNVTLGDYPTSHVDGTQPGCEWTAAAHASTSARMATSRAGGRWLNLDADFGFRITEMIDSGMPPVSNISDTYALAAGGQVQGQKVHERSFSLMGKFIGTSLTNLNALRQALINATKPDAVPETADGPQPFWLRYTGAEVVKKIAVHYESGLEARINGRFVCSEVIPLRVFADDPYFYELGNSAALLDTSDTETLRYMSGRERNTGQWGDLGLSANPTANGTISAIAVDPNNGDVYFAGTYTNLDGGTIDNIVRYTPSTGVFSPLQAAGAFSSSVYALAFAPNGDLYIGGSFINAGTVPTADTICKYTPSTDTISAVGNPTTAPAFLNSVDALAFGLDGTLFIGGLFTQMGGVVNASYVASFDGTNYAALAAGGPNQTVEALAVGPSGTLYLGGLFGTPDFYATTWDGTAYTGLNGGDPNARVRVIVVSSATGEVILGGDFTAIGGETRTRIVRYDDQQTSEMGAGSSFSVYSVAFAPDGSLWSGGTYSLGAGAGPPDQFGIWNGSSWVSPDMALPPAGATVRSIAFSKPAPVISQNYSAWVGFNTTGATEIAGSVIITNSGTEHALPVLYIERTGGTEAIVKQVRNEDTGRKLSINYVLLDGERLTINLVTLAVTSSQFGNVPGAILPGSDFGTFDFLSGPNQITAFVDTDATITAWTEYTDTYWSMD